MDCPVVTTAKGKVSGSIVTLNCEDATAVRVYRNIPYGKPPVGNLRFLAPHPPDSWEGVRDGTVPSKQPMQDFGFERKMEKFFPIKRLATFDYVFEDCLYLTVYVPHGEQSEKLPVMMWIYGGAFQSGSDLFYDVSALAGLNDVIVVIPNYRVGVFGFLSLGPASQCPGNAGLLDQNLALKWVQDNIEGFGGDRDNVTIFGESAGGISVHFHVISPSSNGLFHRAISQSGQATMPGLWNDASKRKAALLSLLTKLGITTESGNDILQALQEIPALALRKAMADMMIEDGLGFYPTADGVFLERNPSEYMEQVLFANRVPYIIGCNSTEGQGVAGMSVYPHFASGIAEDEVRKHPYTSISDEKFELCKEFYIKDETDPARFSKLFGSIVGDSMFVVPAVHTASLYSAEGLPVYVYLGAFRLRMFFEKSYGKDIEKKPEWCICDHVDDVQMMHGLPFAPGVPSFGAKYHEEEKLLSRQCMTYITNFAKHGDPNKGAPVLLNWPKYKPMGEHLILQQGLRVGNEFCEDEMKLWMSDTVDETS